jgi:hypothetical protein
MQFIWCGAKVRGARTPHVMGMFIYRFVFDPATVSALLKWDSVLFSITESDEIPLLWERWIAHFSCAMLISAKEIFPI